MRNSVLLDRGTEKLYLYREVRTVDARGNSFLMAGPTYTKHYVNVITDRQSDAELLGQVSVKIVRVHTRHIPGIDSQALVWFRGELWDLARPPNFDRVTRALSHVQFILRSRNEVRPDPEA